MKVLFVIDGLGTGGAERSLAEMLPHLERRGIRTVVACLYRRTEGVQDQVLASGGDVRFLEGGRPSRILALRRLIRSERPDVVHTAIFEATIAGRLAAAGTGVPLITSLVSTPYDPVRLRDPNVSRWKLRAVRTIDAWTGRHLTTRFHAISRAVRDAAVRDLGVQAGTRHGDPSGARAGEARPSVAVEEGAARDGRWTFPKGHPSSSRSAARSTRRDSGISWKPWRRSAMNGPMSDSSLPGDRGHASPRLEEELRRTGLNGEVRFLGHRDDVPDVLAAADIFVFPSLFEGLRGALIEAMALGLPIVASDLPAVREVVEEGGNAVLVPPGSPRHLAAATRDLLDDPARRVAFGARGREIFEERFTLDRSVERMVELYERVVREGRHA